MNTDEKKQAEFQKFLDEQVQYAIDTNNTILDRAEAWHKERCVAEEDLKEDCMMHYMHVFILIFSDALDKRGKRDAMEAKINQERAN